MADIRVYSDEESDSKDSAQYGGSVLGIGEDDKDKKSRAFVACKFDDPLCPFQLSTYGHEAGTSLLRLD